MPPRPSVKKSNNLAINVFGWDKGVNVYRLSTQPDGMARINNCRLSYSPFSDIGVLDRNNIVNKISDEALQLGS